MRNRFGVGLACALSCAAVRTPCARAEFTFSAQQREVSATTSADGATLAASAVDFSPFITGVLLSTTFVGAAGDTRPNTAEGGIDCTLDPNAISVRGSLAGTGGLNISGGLETGEASVFVLTTFAVTEPTMVSMFATPRPSEDPRDEFEIELVQNADGHALFFLDETSPAQSVNRLFLLAPGSYTLQFQAELSVSGAMLRQAFDFRFAVPAPGSALAITAGVVGLTRRRRASDTRTR